MEPHDLGFAAAGTYAHGGSTLTLYGTTAAAQHVRFDDNGIPNGVSVDIRLEGLGHWKGWLPLVDVVSVPDEEEGHAQKEG